MKKRHVSGWRAALNKYLFRNSRAMIGLAIILFFGAVALFAPQIAPYNPKSIEFMPWTKPDASHILGVDAYGRDVFSNLVYGTRVTITVGVLAGVITAAIGTIVGLVAGYKGGAVGEVLMRIVDVFLTIPMLAFMIVIASLLDSMTTKHTVLIIGLFSWMWMARSVRSQTLSEKKRDYIDAARALGMGNTEIMFKELLPNIIPVITANAVMVITTAMLTEASMSFLGIGDPTSTSWGKMLSIAYDNAAIVRRAWYWILPPGFCIATLGYAFMLIGNSFLDQYASDRGGSVEL
ncbi:MAG: ABC transporter permease [Christensenellales bacterium]|jgi:peptide/nickel transport system permease protein